MSLRAGAEQAKAAMPKRAGPIYELFRRWCGAGEGQAGSSRARSVDFKEWQTMLQSLNLMPDKIGKHKVQEIFKQANRRPGDPMPDGNTSEMDWDEFEFAVQKVCEFCKVLPQALVGETTKQKEARIRRETEAANILSEDRRRKEAEAAELARLDCKILGKASCPRPEIGMRVKLQNDVPVFIRDLTEPAVRYRRPPPLIGTVVKVVGDPLEEKRTHDFKYRRCNQTGRAKYPVAMWCDVRWDAPAKGQEVTITGYHTGRFGMHYLKLVTEDEDPRNDPRNIALREDVQRQLALNDAVAQRFQARAVAGADNDRESATTSSSRLPSAKGSRPRSADDSNGSRTPGTGHTPRYWADSQASTHSRAYHSQEALDQGFDFAGKQKTLDRLVVAQKFWDDPAEETPNQRRLRRFSAGHRPGSSSHQAQQEIIASRPSSRGSAGSAPLISADYDVLRPDSRGSVGFSVASGERPASRGVDGILRSGSRGDVGVQDDARPASRGSVVFQDVGSMMATDAHGGGKRPSSTGSRRAGEDNLRPSSRGSVDMPGKASLEGSTQGEETDGESLRDRPGSSTTGSVMDASSRPGTGGLDETSSRPGTGAGYGAGGGSRPASRANVRFSDGSRPGSALAVLGSNDPGFDRPQNASNLPHFLEGSDSEADVQGSRSKCNSAI